MEPVVYCCLLCGCLVALPMHMHASHAGREALRYHCIGLLACNGGLEGMPAV